MVFSHQPVLCDHVVSALVLRDDAVVVDCTLGGGGHSEAILQASGCRVIGLDRDPAALAAARERLAHFGDRFEGVHAAFDQLQAVLQARGLRTVHGVLADLGVSSHQLDTAARGFSFRQSGPIDMRMDPSSGAPAADLVNQLEADALADLIYRYGEERRSRAVARAIVAGRPWDDTRRLAAAIAKVVGRGKGRIHPATRTFQALRISVNDELGQIERLLPQALALLRPGGRLAILSFHSLEDRIVKRFMAREAGRDTPRDPWGTPIGPVRLRVIKSITPPPDDPNPRARSARLRAAERIPWNES